MKHEITIAPSAAMITDANGRVSELPKQRSGTHRARCTCRWIGQERSTEAAARIDGQAHLRLVPRAERMIDHFGTGYDEAKT
jgi:hypothetical protein